MEKLDYEKKYKEALGRAKKWASQPTVWSSDDICQKIFPELRESGDEKIIRIIIKTLQDINKKYNTMIGDILLEDCIAWLEKQGEMKSQGKSALEVWKDMRLEVYQQASGNRHEPNYSDDSTKMFSLTDIDEIFEKIAEKQGEQKTTNNIEPKFKVGDWVVNKETGTIHQIKEVIEVVTNHTYGYDATNGGYISTSKSDKYHLWTIQDAQIGDVLVASDGSIFLFAGLVDCVCSYYVALTTNKDIKISKAIGGSYWETSKAVHPATNKQRNLLFQKMKEKGYEWDGEKKELKEIFPELKESDDESIRKSIIDLVKKQMPKSENKKWMLAWLEKRGENQSVEGTFINVDDVRDNFVSEVYRVLDMDSTNDRANQIIDAFDSLPTIVIPKQKTVEPVTVIERDGEQWVRVCALGEDFIIAAHDYKDGNKTEFAWEEACNIGTFTIRQGYIMLALLNEINAKLKEIGGEPLSSNYWSSLECTSNGACGVYFHSGYVGYGYKSYSHVAREVVTF